MRKIWLLAVLFLVSVVRADQDYSIVLYQPDSVLSVRLGGDVKALVEFINVVSEQWEKFVPDASVRKKTSIVVAFGVNRQTTAWLVGIDGEKPAQSITDELRSAKHPWLRMGNIAFALKGSDYETESFDEISLPLPEEWVLVSEAAQDDLSVEDVLDRVLPASASLTVNLPDGFESQILEPTGGKILRPNGWFYAEAHQGPSYSWILSKENPKLGPYKTGMRLQVLVGIEEGTGKTTQQFCDDFLDRKAQVARVLNYFPITKQGLFLRRGLEVEEEIAGETYHIIYSAFWLDSNMVLISTAGAPADVWEDYEHIFNVMGSFELIDMGRFSDRED